ncbi:hypothetical protein G6F57_022320 [Rhizopus arrhizus]|nr:hypothetical protein G6F57_022320 [Rhizopus arrhizus]
MALAHFGDFRGPRVKAALRTHEANQAGVLRGQGFGRHFNGTAAQFGVAAHIFAVFLFQQQAGAFALQQQDGGQQVLGNALQRALYHPRRQLRARGGARQQRRG